LLKSEIGDDFIGLNVPSHSSSCTNDVKIGRNGPEKNKVEKVEKQRGYPYIIYKF